MQWLRATSIWFGLAIAPLVLSSCGELLLSSPQASAPPIANGANPEAIPSAAAPAANSPSLAAAASPVTPTAGDIWSQLRQGQGYVILFRHALAPGTGDPTNFRLGDCSTQRNLSMEGRQQAVRMGESLRQQNLVISRVLSSQWCRCLETARLMAVSKVESFVALNSFFQDRSSAATQTAQLRQFIRQNRTNAGVVVMVTHQVNITEIANIVPQSGAAVVMRASEASDVEFVGQLDPL